MSKKRMIYFSLIILSATFLSGCWSNVEIDRQVLVKGIALDAAEGDNRVMISMEVLQLEDRGGGESKIKPVVKSATGFTVFEAARNMIKQVGKKPLYSSNEMILISEELAREGINQYIDFFNRNREIRRRSSFAITKGKAVDILKSNYDLDPFVSKGLNTTIESSRLLGIIYPSNLFEFTMNLIKETGDPLAGYVFFESDKTVIVEGSALFKKDKYICHLSRTETRGANLVLNPDQVKGTIVLKTPDEEKYITMEILKVKSKVIAQKQDKYSIKISLEAEGNIQEDMSSYYKIENEANIKQLNKRFAQVIQNEIKSVVDISKKYQADVLGFGEAINKRYPKYYQEIKDQWRGILPSVPVEIEVKAVIKRNGMIREGIGKYK